MFVDFTPKLMERPGVTTFARVDFTGWLTLLP